MGNSSWNDLPSALGDSFSKFTSLLSSDPQLKAFVTTDTINKPVTFAYKSSGSDNSLLITVTNGSAKASTGSAKDALFTLSAPPEHWEKYFQKVPVAPYQSYWGMVGLNLKKEGAEIQGDQTAMAQWSHVWRRVLELAHDAHCGPMEEAEDEPEQKEDHITGRYVYLETSVWGRVKVFYEWAGNGKQQIVFLHNGGADSRQFHGLMSGDRQLRQKLTMYAFDMPGHGRSFPPQKVPAGAYTNTEDGYVQIIGAFVKALGLRRPIICGAGMAGQACLAVAIRNREVQSGGVIPLQGSGYISMERPSYERSPYVNQALFNPEWMYSMISPTTPYANKQLLWHLYSGQAYGILHGDLAFSNATFDARPRLASIDTTNCPVYMLTGSYDYATTPSEAQATADKIPGAKHKVMEGLGHFPMTERPGAFKGYLMEAVEFIQAVRREGLGNLRLEREE
ncbi:alpha/beta-hydrolase [Westerdykella ornata]|uniref:Alpha/beta-hydrolase n=1 Tax=Westerdykella ornata TaxID=318751 RepID=A0A6A6JHC8_WESOR|nr:alpha/beta-hydrolase [Westerdykella ornata]KAF2275812.1 alpha/beta-hydrolase [Westerdykella ornata]